MYLVKFHVSTLAEIWKVGNGAIDFCEGHCASGVAHGDNGEKRVGRQAGNDVSCSGAGGETRQVEGAGVR